ncbi:hypothetical protein D8T63_17205 [Vibrio vulnificus]|uniref:hypothetical protein n=1 Tax=Vibrio vulnificus TaxID=672 RepID=UPI0010289B26|nr:hypothetical protein [Vibrio vulnificus]RZR23467.1 hypothetical protein D8T63_17205 [Vibrio vulnificus]
MTNSKNRFGNKFIGAHVSAAGGGDNAPLRARGIGANAFALFTKNKRPWGGKPLEKENIAAVKAKLAVLGVC